MNYLSLFSGIGGFELGIGRAHPEWKCVGYSEIDPYALKVYQHHFPTHECFGDITQIDPGDLPEFDLVCGGFPCQAFSIAGRRQGFADRRGTLFFEIERLLKYRRCRYLLLENVKGLLTHDGGRSFHAILLALEELGYDIQWQVINSRDFGVPQNRERVYILANIRGMPRPEVFPLFGTGTQDIGLTAHRAVHLHRSKLFGTCLSSRHFYALRASHPTGVARMADATIRRLTPVECERLQGFPDDWTEGLSETQRYKCLGNAVTVTVVHAVAARLPDAAFA